MTRQNLEASVLGMLREECYEPRKAREVLADILMELNMSGAKSDIISRQDFLVSCSESKTLLAFMMSAAKNEQKKREESKRKEQEKAFEAALASAALTEDSKKRKRKRKKKKPKAETAATKGKEDPLEKYISVTPSGSRRGSFCSVYDGGFQRMSRRKSLFA